MSSKSVESEVTEKEISALHFEKSFHKIRSVVGPRVTACMKNGLISMTGSDNTHILLQKHVRFLLYMNTDVVHIQ